MSVIMRMTIDYESMKRVKALTPELYSELRAKCDGFGLPEDQTQVYEYSVHEHIGFLGDLEFLDKLGITPKVSRVRGQFAEALPKLGVPESAAPVQIVHVAVPNVGLFSVRSVAVLEDACTDYLQSVLDNGWRIIAVCPPNDCRRPSYIVGHVEEGLKP